MEMDVLLYYEGRLVHRAESAKVSIDEVIVEGDSPAFARDNYVELELLAADRTPLRSLRLPAVITSASESRMSFRFECPGVDVLRALNMAKKGMDDDA